MYIIYYSKWFNENKQLYANYYFILRLFWYYIKIIIINVMVRRVKFFIIIENKKNAFVNYNKQSNIITNKS